MKVSNIVPTKWIKDWSQDFVMALANYMDYDRVNEYEKAIVESGKTVVLDNGAFETGLPDGIDSLFRKTKRLKAFVVYAPDHFYDAKQTEEAFEAMCYIRKKLEIEDQRLGAIVQANNLEDFLKLYKKFEADERVYIIGLSYKAISQSLKYETAADVPKITKKKKDSGERIEETPDYTSDRLKMLRILSKLPGVRKSCHLLGLGDSFADVIYAKKNYPWCILNDTSTCFMAGSHGKVLVGSNLLIPGGKITEKIFMDKDTLAPGQKKCIEANIKKVIETICLDK